MAEAAVLTRRPEAGEAADDFALWAAELGTEPAAVQEVAELDSEREARARAAALFGRVATGTACEIRQAPSSETTTLMEAIHRAREGDPVAKRMIETNVSTDVIERSIKAGHIMKVSMDANEQGQILQFGQTSEAIQENSLRFASGSPEMLGRTQAEARNMYRIEALKRQGLLKDHVLVVFSLAADNMSVEAMEKAGFFVDTMSVAMQATTEESNGSITTESAFVAGKRNRHAEREDKEVIGRLGDMLGVAYRGKSAAQIIDMPVLIRKDLMKNGVVDVVAWWDAAAGGTFFGQDKPRQDYLKYLGQCREREMELRPTVDYIVAQLIREAGSIDTPVAATRRLHKLSEAALLERALTDEKIDGTVFGAEAAFFLEGARHQLMLGDMQGVEELMSRAASVAKSGSCPTGDMDMLGESNERSGKERDDADCEYMSKSCPLCGKKNVFTKDRQIEGDLRAVSGSCGCIKVYTKPKQRK